MIITLINWIVIAAAAFISGFAVREVSKKLFEYEIAGADGIMMSGIVMLTLYAEIFSLFSGVSLKSFILLGAIILIILLVFWRKISDYLMSLIKSEHFTAQITVLVLLTAVLSVISASVPKDYDTYLYHIQSIKWIESYGAVRGLGNLHVRFGYNSAFMCLQALFSWSFTGRSYHQMNGFICLLFLQYALSDNFIIRKHKIDGTDMLKLAMVMYALYKCESISSPGSDIFPVLIAFYIMAKWNSLYRDGNRGYGAYGLLCLLALYGMTVKLSIAPVILLTIYPAILLIKSKKAKQTVCFIFSGIFILLPYLIRNVIITGYLLYPLEKLDIFSVDWKIPREKVAADRYQIALYGKNMQNAGTDSFTMKTWVQVWYTGLDFMQKIYLTIFLVSFAVSVIYVIYSIIKKKNSMQVLMLLISMASFLYWFISSPLIRYGIAFLWLLPCVLAGCIANEKAGYIYASWMTVVILSLALNMFQNYPGDTVNLIYPADYTTFSCHETHITDKDGRPVTIMVPDTGDQCGYDVFPETPYNLEGYVKLRGTSLAQGFEAIK